MAVVNEPKTIAVTYVEGLSSSARVDKDAGIIRGVKLIGFESKNGRTYPPNVLKASVHLYEGAKVNIDHPERDPSQPRKYGERLGAIRGARFVEGSGIFGDFHFNPNHPLAKQVTWDAENSPESLGFSHNALLRVAAQKQNGREVIDSIVAIRSMDLVADPATTKSLYESELPMDPVTPAAPSQPASDPKTAMKGAFRQMIMAAVDDESLDVKATMKKIAEIMKAQAKLMGEPSADPAEPAPGAEQVQWQSQIALLTEQVKQYQAKEAQVQRLEQIGKELAAAGLDSKNPRHVSELFSKQLLATESVDERKALISDRAALLGAVPSAAPITGAASASVPSGGPTYTPPVNTLEQLDAKQFASRLLR